MRRNHSPWIYEHRSAPLAPRAVFLRRVAKHGDVEGWRRGCPEGMPWIDAYLNAAMILGGMGPVGELHTTAGKIFAGTYAIFAGVIFLVMVGVVLAPVAHRVLHRLHLEAGEES